MAKLIEMDEHVTLARQMEEEDISGPIILFNRFTVNPEDVDGFLKAWLMMLHSWSNSLDISQLNCTEVLLVAPLSLTMRFGNLWQHTEMLSTKLAFGLDYPTILTAPSYLHICSGRLRSLGSLKIESVWHISAVLALTRCKFWRTMRRDEFTL